MVGDIVFKPLHMHYYVLQKTAFHLYQFNFDMKGIYIHMSLSKRVE